jgi:hypothetical protein
MRKALVNAVKMSKKLKEQLSILERNHITVLKADYIPMLI